MLSIYASKKTNILRIFARWIINRAASKVSIKAVLDKRGHCGRYRCGGPAIFATDTLDSPQRLRPASSSFTAGRRQPTKKYFLTWTLNYASAKIVYQTEPIWAEIDLLFPHVFVNAQVVRIYAIIPHYHPCMLTDSQAKEEYSLGLLDLDCRDRHYTRLAIAISVRVCGDFRCNGISDGSSCLANLASLGPQA